LVGYTDGYLIQFPFKFPVDKATFRTVQRKGEFTFRERDEIPSLKEFAGEWRRPIFQNDGVVYDKYL
jgi:hypothetical protein